MKNPRRLLTAIALLALPLLGVAWEADYAREQRWADEVAPGVVVGDPVFLETPRGHHKFLTLFTPAESDGKAAIVVHGLGIHPDWGMVGALRTELADLGFTTLSIQMPVLAADAKGDAYPPTFPEAVERIGEAVAFLKAKGYDRIAVVSHSMGSRMSWEYFAGQPDPAIVSWASLGPSFKDYSSFKLPILDLYGENDLPAVLKNAEMRKASLTNPAANQSVIAHADHFYTGHEHEMVEAVANFLRSTLK